MPEGKPARREARRAARLALVVLAVVLALALASPAAAERRPFAPPGTAPSYMPARSYDLVHRQLDLAFDWQAKSVAGTVVNRLTPLLPGTRTIDLHAVGLEVERVTVDGAEAAWEERPEERSLRIDLGREVAPGVEVAVAVEYAAGPGRLPASAAEPSPVPAAEHAARRARVAAALGPDAMLVIVAPEPASRNGDVSWPFRQDDDLFWLTGVALPGSALVLVTGPEGGDEPRTVLFAPAADPRAELWTGPVPTFAELTATSGIEEVAEAAELRPFLAAALSGRPWGEADLYRYYRAPVLPDFARAVAAGSATAWLDLGDRGFGTASAPLALAGELGESWPELRLANVTPLVSGLREIKSPAELALLARAIEITGEAIRAGMRRSLTAERENQVAATVEHTFRDLGACCWGFPSIVAAGANTTILHYEAGEDPVPRDGLVLLDVGADFGGYTADVTRTFPADGTFSDDQRAIYQAVLEVWEAMLPELVAGTRYADVHQAAVARMGEELLALGLVTENVPEQVTAYFPHGLGHPLGLAVHDVFDRTRVLEPGMVWSLEPGLYVRPDDVAAGGAFAALAAEEQARVRAALERYAGLGVRIEDDVLITEGAPRVLSDGAPRTVEAIERWMAGD